MAIRAQQLNIRLSAEEREFFEDAASEAGLGVSEWTRTALLAAAKICPLCGLANHIEDELEQKTKEVAHLKTMLATERKKRKPIKGKR